MTERLQASFLLGFLLMAGMLAIQLNHPPSPLPASAPPGQFSAYRALEYLKQFAREPHPTGTPEHDRVRDYLVEQLRLLGISPEIQRATGVTGKFGAAGNVQNIVARLNGTRPGAGALMLAAHYDSVPAGPGNGDDGAGVAAILEALRALRTQPPLTNDIIILFTDGEEETLLGASAFMAEHPWAKDVRLTLNFEGRGNAGISQLFETSPENGRLIREFATAAPHPFGSSLAYEIYKHLPNDTDMTVFKRHGSAGLNFAFVGHWEAYHAPIDTLENLSLSSLQHHGENALSLARHFGNGDLNSLRQRDAVYFSVPGMFLARYSAFWIWPLAFLAFALFLLSFPRHLRAQQIQWKKALLALLGLSSMTALLPVGGLALSNFFHWLHRRALPDGPVFQSTPYWLSAIALLAAVWTAIYLWLRKHLAAPNLAQAAAFILLILVLVTSRQLPGGSYLVLWPLLSLLAAIWVGLHSERPRTRFVPTALLCLLTLPALTILTPDLSSFFEVLGVTSAGGPAIALPLVLLLIALTPQIEIVSDVLGPKLPFAALMIGLVCLGRGALTTRYSAARPKATVLYYALDADSGRGLWASTATRNDSWTEQFVGLFPRRGKLPDFMLVPGLFPIEFLRAEAPPVTLAPPEATLIDQSRESDQRLLTLRIRSLRAARSLTVRIPDKTVLESSVNGRPLPTPPPTGRNPEGKWNLSFANLPPDGIELKLRVQGAGPVKLSVVDWSLGLPKIPGRHFDPRPPDAMTVHTGDQTLVHRTFVF